MTALADEAPTLLRAPLEASESGAKTRVELVDAARISLPTPRGLWQRLTRIGVTRAMSPADAKYIILVNTFVLINTVLTPCLVLLPQPLSGRLILLLVGALVLLVLALNHRRRHALAALLLNTVALVGVCAQTFVGSGVNLGSQFFALVIACAPFFTFPRERTGLALLIATLSAAAFVVAGFFYATFNQATSAGPLVFTSAVTGAALLAALIGYYTRRIAREAEGLTELKRSQTDLLLRTVLPSHVAARLKGSRAHEREPLAEQHDRVSVIVCDIAGFTALSETMAPEELVGLLDALFSEFDALCLGARVEKIRTIGDAYIAAAGLRGDAERSSSRALSCARAMIRVTEAFARRRGLALGVRVGVSTGSAVAGVLGKRRLSYDLWGPAVHRATALEAAAP
ncbi:MAG: adenylate/guanylate cyclase domain-containing protein, partial [Myxococcales bacterium]|nr:adenylate/guanylate cyclase domain-containing protein [Myxococcales bacterium]